MTEPAPQRCPRCALNHDLFGCPQVKAIDLEHGGDFNSIRRVEFLTPVDFHREAVQPGSIEPGYPAYRSK